MCMGDTTTSTPTTQPSLKCTMCNRPIGAHGVVYTLTEEERHIMRVLLQSDADVPFCQACNRLSKDPNAFAQFMKGVKLTQLRGLGVPIAIAEQHAQKEYDFYLRKAMESMAQKPTQ